MKPRTVDPAPDVCTIRIVEHSTLPISIARCSQSVGCAVRWAVVASPAESFMKTIKTEEVYLGGYETFTDVIHALPHFIDDSTLVICKNRHPTGWPVADVF